MRSLRAGTWLALLLLAGCEQASAPSSARASLSSCNGPADCPAPPGACATVSCVGHACTPVVNPVCACTGPSDCDDGDPCTTDSCVLSACVNTVAAGGGCCTVPGDCGAANACQAPASCLAGSCTFVSNGSAGCCNTTGDCAGSATCSANTCTCGGGGRYCPGIGCVAAGGCCAAAECDATHSNGASCAGGLCSYTSCKAGFGDCVQTGANLAGCETNLNTSATHCGSCTRACSASGTATVTCAGGLCTSSCAAGFGNCTQPAAPTADDGCESDLNNSVSSCGGCGRACASTNTAAVLCSGGLCTSSCGAGFANCSHPAFPTADNGCEINVASDPSNCGGCGIACAAPMNSCQVTSCAGQSCGYLSTGGAGCCNTIAQCAPNVCQNVSCTANRCVYTAKGGVAGCCATPAGCPAQTDPCKANTCLNNVCGVMAVTCSDGGADLAVVDMTPPADLMPEDLAVADLETSSDLQSSVDAAVLDRNLSLTGGGGCAFGGEGAGAGALLCVLLLLVIRRRPA